MRLGICAGLQHFSAAHAAGYAYLEIATALLLPEQDDAAVAPVLATIRNASLPVEVCNCFVPAQIRLTGDAVDHAAVRAHMEVALRRAAAVGAKIMVFGSGGARRAPDGFSLERARAQFVEMARMAADIAARYDITIAMEPLNSGQCNLYTRIDEGIAFVDRVAHPRLGMVPDLFHIALSDEPVAHVRDAGTRIVHVHVPTPAIPEVGAGEAYDFQGFLAAVAHTGYDGRISIEDNPGMFAQAPSLPAAYRAAKEHVTACLPILG